MKSLPKPHFEGARMPKQRGVVLFFALIALVAMSLAAVALIRSVDTGTMIAGNLAFKQSATTSGDAGTEAAFIWLAATQTANGAKIVTTDATHTFNITDATRGYYSNADSTLNLFADATWNAITNIPEVTDASGNKVRYIIQRMCRDANQPIQTAHCLFSGAILDNNGNSTPLYENICTPQPNAPCPSAGQTPQIRITTRTTGPRYTVSYIQAFVY